VAAEDSKEASAQEAGDMARPRPRDETVLRAHLGPLKLPRRVWLNAQRKQSIILNPMV
jgi:hypothetical protein